MSMSTQSSSSISTPVVTETKENSIIDQVSATAQALAGQMVNWAQGVFAQTSQITSQAVGNFFNVSQQMQGLSNNLTGQYNNLFAPENAQLVADANSYASPGRMKTDMGMAGATQAQAGDAALKGSEEALRSYGIDPSSGRYAALDKAAAVQNAANVAGAENQQRMADITTGQNLRQSAVQVGATLPAAIANVNNTAIQANAGAANATDANANTGKNLMDLANPLLSTAMGVKLPLQGQQSSSQSSGQSNSSHPPGSPGSGGGSGGGGAPGGGGGNSSFNPQHGGSGSAEIIPGAPSSGGGDFGFDNSPFINPETENSFTGGEGSMGVGQPGAGGDDLTSGGFGVTNDNPFSSGDFGQSLSGSDFGGGGSNPTYDGLNDMSGAGQGAGMGDLSFNAGASQNGNTADGSTPADWGNGADAFTGGGEDFARGGAIPGAPPPNAGAVPAQMSPSGGRQVDDVRAQGPARQPINLNANEFVIPQDVALWKGQEFFQKLINQSRMANATSPAHGKQQQPQPGMR